MAPTDADGFACGGATSTAHCDALTVLKTAPGFFASKQISKRAGAEPEIRGYNAGMRFHAYDWGVSNIVGLSSALTALETMPNCFVIRGAPAPGLDCTRHQRRKKTNFQTPGRGRYWVLIDFDKVPLPDGLRLADSVAAVSEYLVMLLPPEFHQASYHWQLSSSTSIGDPAVVSMHLWFWLDRPIPDAYLKAWASAWNGANKDRVAGKAIIDMRLFNDVQAHYTAAPTFVGMADPFPVRSGLVRKSLDEVAIKLPARAATLASRGAGGGSIRPAHGFDGILTEIGDHAGGGGFHVPIIRALASYASTHGRDGTDVEALYELVSARVLAADRSAHTDEYIEKTATREHIIPLIEQALDKFGKPSPRRKSRKIEGIAPHFASEPESVATASTSLSNVLEAFFQVR
jgi:hypothetical protein